MSFIKLKIFIYFTSNPIPQMSNRDSTNEEKRRGFFFFYPPLHLPPPPCFLSAQKTQHFPPSCYSDATFFALLSLHMRSCLVIFSLPPPPRSKLFSLLCQMPPKKKRRRRMRSDPFPTSEKKKKKKSVTPKRPSLLFPSYLNRPASLVTEDLST